MKLKKEELSKYQLEYDRYIIIPDQTILPSTGETIEGLAVYIRTDETFLGDKSKGYKGIEPLCTCTALELENCTCNSNGLIRAEYNQEAKKVIYHPSEKLTFGWEVCSYLKWTSPNDVYEITKEEFESILQEIGHLIESDNCLQSGAYGVHWL